MDYWSERRNQFETEYEAGRAEAARRLEGADLDLEDEEQVNDILHDGRLHCGTCTVNTVIEQTEPAILAYIEELEQALRSKP